MTEAIAGYVRSDAIHRVSTSEVRAHPDHPTVRLFGLTLDGGKVFVLLDSDTAQNMSDQLAAAAAELRRVERSEVRSNFGPH